MQGHNQRVFPRIDLQCPISYRDHAQQDWMLSRIIDFSADGLLMLTDRLIRKDQSITIQLKPDKQKILRGNGTVVRCTDKGNGDFHVAIKDIHWLQTEASSEKTEPVQDNAEHRVFPRMPAQCPIRYRDTDTGRWLIGRMLDFSATGLLMTTEHNLEAGSHLTLQIEPGSKKSIPALRGVGMVVRCQHIDTDHFQVAIKMLRIEPPSPKHT
jgi:hypothetical protein